MTSTLPISQKRGRRQTGCCTMFEVVAKMEAGHSNPLSADVFVALHNANDRCEYHKCNCFCLSLHTTIRLHPSPLHNEVE
ncbi:unnamed protein product [Protopolystoma xenopodis]|uniref:Uncharacterized protein n=1 Tax=Protopolystoma xenopodis TaxID=117903 RepID=A0A448WBB7_9PLAT|nr:unnamed protein product [Protopolystoma xenopodis]